MYPQQGLWKRSLWFLPFSFLHVERLFQTAASRFCVGNYFSFEFNDTRLARAKKRCVPDALLGKTGFVLNILVSFIPLNFFWHYKLLDSSRFTLSLMDLLLTLKLTSRIPQRELAHTLDPLRSHDFAFWCCISYWCVSLQSKFWLFSIYFMVHRAQ